MDWIPRDDVPEDSRASWHTVHYAAERNDVNAIRREIPQRGVSTTSSMFDDMRMSLMS